MADKTPRGVVSFLTGVGRVEVGKSLIFELALKLMLHFGPFCLLCGIAGRAGNECRQSAAVGIA